MARNASDEVDQVQAHMATSSREAWQKTQKSLLLFDCILKLRDRIPFICRLCIRPSPFAISACLIDTGCRRR
jgi:hypothetical protein